MQLMCHGFSVLGSRHGILFDPFEKQCGIVRFDRFTRLPALQLRAGMVIGGKEYVLPLCRDGHALDFYDQRISPCTIVFFGIHAGSATRLKLTATIPFRPRDGQFSTRPVISFHLQADALGGQYRWTKKSVELDAVTLFLEFGGPGIELQNSGTDCLDMSFASVRSATFDGMKDAWDTKEEKLRQLDRLVALEGERRGKRFETAIALDRGRTEPGASGRQGSPRAFAEASEGKRGPQRRASLEVAWCTFSEPVLEVHGNRFPFKYTEEFSSIDEVADWVRANPDALRLNAETVDGIIGDNNCSQSVNLLMAQTLHSWLLNTWWGVDDGRDWFSVWEGTCYMQSTVDVEYTQAPFYLAVWPELLGIELDWWPDYSRDGCRVLGPGGEGTAYLCHDMGAHACANGQIYSHDMAVEEAVNYVIMAFAHWRRTGLEAIIRKHADTIGRYLDFVVSCDTTGNGIPDVGVTNTIDDASPAIHFGKEQVYLAVKALAAMVAGVHIARLTGRGDDADRYEAQAGRIRATIAEHGWNGRHFNTLLRPDGELTNPWTGETVPCDEIPGWNAPQIFTLHGAALLDMVGVDLGLIEEHVHGDLSESIRRCLREYGCAHTDFSNEELVASEEMLGFVGVAANPGWVSANLLRDIAALYRGCDVRFLADRYWNWQVVTNTQEPKLFFESFRGNNLCFYPRGVAVWGYFDAVAGQVIDKVNGVDERRGKFDQAHVPKLLDADWGHCRT